VRVLPLDHLFPPGLAVFVDVFSSTIVQIVHAINDYTQAMQDGLRLAIRQ
jgi:hypothetical protein